MSRAQEPLKREAQAPRQDQGSTSKLSNPGPLLFPAHRGLNHDEGWHQNLTGYRPAQKDPSHPNTSGCSGDYSKHSNWLHKTIKSLVKTGRLKTSEVSEPRGPPNRAKRFLKLQPLKIIWGIVLDCPLPRTIPFSSFVPFIVPSPSNLFIPPLRHWYHTFRIQNIPSISLTALETGRRGARTTHSAISHTAFPSALVTQFSPKLMLTARPPTTQCYGYLSMAEVR
ncbi:hypothetical protein B0H14DRAFT_2561902 [Mycena olivaceomarginata]|nr:hypothetical protein B0H14DRAFT_2561902 [Mycena olivaceomarginata]